MYIIPNHFHNYFIHGVRPRAQRDVRGARARLRALYVMLCDACVALGMLLCSPVLCVVVLCVRTWCFCMVCVCECVYMLLGRSHRCAV